MVYVGYKEYRYRNMIMSHIVADTVEELHQMANNIGVQRKWFQDKTGRPHYDICKAKKKLAIKFGAKEVIERELINIFV